MADSVKGKLLDLALQKYSRNQVSIGRAAELAKVPLADFMKAASERKIPLSYSVESLEKDFRAVTSK